MHVEPRGFASNDLFCDGRGGGEYPLGVLHEIIHERIGESRVLYPDQVRRGHASMIEALREHGWPYVDELLGKFVFSLNLFRSNEACRQTYYRMWSDVAAAVPPVAARRKIFFDRAAQDDEGAAESSQFSAFVEGEQQAYSELNSGMMTRMRMPGRVDSAEFLRVRYERTPSQIFSFDFAP